MRALLERIDPVHYFERLDDFEVAIAEAEEWWHRYLDVYAAHCRRLSVMATQLPSELLAAMTVAELLCSLNDSPVRCAPVGEEALLRLQCAGEEIRSITPEPEAVPEHDAVLAAVDVHRRCEPL